MRRLPGQGAGDGREQVFDAFHVRQLVGSQVSVGIKGRH
jgi:hypothetical protein